MRNAILAATVALTLVTGELRADTPKPLPADVGPGRIVWFDLTTTNLPQSKDFYGKLFEWEYTPVEGTQGMVVEIMSRGTGIGTLRVAEGNISPFNGVAYVQVNDIQASCARAKELGGSIVPGFPINLPDSRGSIALVIDPSGHPIGMYSRTPIPPPAPPAP